MHSIKRAGGGSHAPGAGKAGAWCPGGVQGCHRTGDCRKFDGYTLPGDTAEGVIRQYGKERVAIVLANTIMHLSHDGRFSPTIKEWAKSLMPSADWQTRDYIVTSHPAVLDGFTNQAREYIERDREPEKAAVPEREAGTSGKKHKILNRKTKSVTVKKR